MFQNILRQVENSLANYFQQMCVHVLLIAPFMFHVIWAMPQAFKGLKSIFWLTSNCLFGHFVWTGSKNKKWTIAILVCCDIFTHNKFMNLNERLVLEGATKLIFWSHVKIYCVHLSNINWMACYSYYCIYFFIDCFPITKARMKNKISQNNL